MELWDAYDALGRKTGQTLVRDEAVPQGLFHLTADVALRHADGSFLITRRDLNKPAYPGYWELGAGGSALKGEDLLTAARRELKEETGIDGESFTRMYWIVDPRVSTIYAGFMATYSGDKNAVRLQAGETIDYRWLTARELVAFCKTDAFVTSQKPRWKVLLHRLEEEIK